MKTMIDTTVIHTACRHCGQDIEGIAPYPVGDWRDRGNNWTCPTPEGDAGLRHAPIDEALKSEPTADEWSGYCDPCDPANYWIDDETGERVSAETGERLTHTCPAEPAAEQAQHTPTPWEVVQRPQSGSAWSSGMPIIRAGQTDIADIRWNGHNQECGQANAELIVAAVNAYASNQRALEVLKTAYTNFCLIRDGNIEPQAAPLFARQVAEYLRAALAAIDN